MHSFGLAEINLKRRKYKQGQTQSHYLPRGELSGLHSKRYK